VPTYLDFKNESPSSTGNDPPTLSVGFTFVLFEAPVAHPFVLKLVTFTPSFNPGYLQYSNMLSYMSLLVLVLATSTVSPVWAIDPLEIEGTSHSEPSERPRFKINKGKVLVGIVSLAVVGIFIGNLVGGGPPPPQSNNNEPTTTTQPTPATQPSAPPPTSPPSPTPTTPPRAFAGREVRTLNRRGLSVDTSKARSISDNSNQKMHISSLDLLNRAHLGEALRQFSRMLDEID